MNDPTATGGHVATLPQAGTARAGSDRPPSQLTDAIGYTSDRLERLEHLLDTLTGVCEPITRDAPPAAPYEPPSSVDERPLRVRQVAALGIRLDTAGDRLAALIDRLEV